MKFKSLISFVVLIAVLFSSCAQSLVCKGVEYEPVGVFTKSQKKEEVEYKTKAASIILGILFIETIAVPIYLWGFKLFEPKRCKEKSLPLE